MGFKVMLASQRTVEVEKADTLEFKENWWYLKDKEGKAVAVYNPMAIIYFERTEDPNTIVVSR